MRNRPVVDAMRLVTQYYIIIKKRLPGENDLHQNNILCIGVDDDLFIHSLKASNNEINKH
jgi:hypothetical protein